MSDDWNVLKQVWGPQRNDNTGLNYTTNFSDNVMWIILYNQYMTEHGYTVDRNHVLDLNLNVAFVSELSPKNSDIK